MPFLLIAGFLFAAFCANAQQQPKVYRLGILTMAAPDLQVNFQIDAFIQELAALGYVEGKTLIIERRFADGHIDRLPALTTELVQAKVDLIYAGSTVLVHAANPVAGTIPIVFSAVSDPVGSGFAASLAHPGGYITGTSSVNQDLTAKRLQLLKESSSKISRLAVFTSSGEGLSQKIFAEVQRAAGALKMKVLSVDVNHRDDYAPGFASARKWGADSIFVISSNTNGFNKSLIVQYAEKYRLPTIVPEKRYAEAGGLISYGPDYDALSRRAAAYVDKIFKGAKPGDLPIEQPTKFEMVVNLKTAKSLGIKIPNIVMVRADKVIE